MTRKEKINFLILAEKQEPKYFNYTNKYGDFSNVNDEQLNELVEELDWMWK